MDPLSPSTEVFLCSDLSYRTVLQSQKEKIVKEFAWKKSTDCITRNPLHIG